MAYTIISQNNTTTTLADENGNVITVPARVTLATSTDYTIIKVNNNSVDLQDGDGKIFRGIPACVVLAGEGGGGGGSVDYSKTVQKSSTIPAAGASNVDQVYLYTGATNANFTQNYIYKNVKTATYTGTVSFEAATLSSSTIACSGSDFATFVAEWGSGDITTITNGTITYDQSGGLLVFVGKDAEDTTVCTFQLYTEDYQDAGFTITGTLQDGDVFAFTCSISEASATYAWTRVDVQPTPDPLPSQTGNSGKFLTTDGTDASWEAINALQNTATGTDSLTILGTASFRNQSINIGINSNAKGAHSTSVGDGAEASTNAVAVGLNAKSNAYGIGIGSNANAQWVNSIQLSCTINGGTNNDANTFKVANSNGNYEIMSADGTIPEARLADTTNAQQGDVLTLDSTGNAVWQASSGGGLPSQTGQSGKFLTTDGTDASWSDKISFTSSTAPDKIKLSGFGTIYPEVVIGQLVSGYADIAIGTVRGSSSYATRGVVGIGLNVTASGYCSIAIGKGAIATGNYAIQLSTGSSATNSDANTFKVANANGNFEMMNANGNLPADRLASTTGLADGNYRLRLVMASGVPTLEWVAE